MFYRYFGPASPGGFTTHLRVLAALEAKVSWPNPALAVPPENKQVTTSCCDHELHDVACIIRISWGITCSISSFSWDIVNNISYQIWIFLVFSGHFLSKTSCYGKTPLTHIIAYFGRRTATSRHLKPRPPGKMFRITHTFERDPMGWILHISSLAFQSQSTCFKYFEIQQHCTSLCKHTHFWTENT